MLPQSSNVQVMTDLDIISQPDKTYYIDKEKKIIQGTVEDYLKAVEQSVYLILQTERYDYIMYSHKYGRIKGPLWSRGKLCYSYAYAKGS